LNNDGGSIPDAQRGQESRRSSAVGRRQQVNAIVVKLRRTAASCGSVTVESTTGNTSVSTRFSRQRPRRPGLNPVRWPPGRSVVVKGSDGKTKEQKVTVAGTPMNVNWIDDRLGLRRSRLA